MSWNLATLFSTSQWFCCKFSGICGEPENDIHVVSSETHIKIDLNNATEKASEVL